MKVDRTTVSSVALTLLLVASVLPAGLGGPVGTARADHDGAPVYTIRQPGTDVCYEVTPYTADHPKMVPEVDVRGEIEYFEYNGREADVYGDFRHPNWNGFESIESQMDYRYFNDTNPDPNESAVRGQTAYYAPYLNSQYRWEGWAYATYGKYNWSHDGHSHLWFYENPNGEVSLVIRHDKLNDQIGISSHNPYNGMYGPGDGFHEPAPGGGTADWTFHDLPRGEWAYLDDMYPRAEIDDTYRDRSGTMYGHRRLAARNDSYEPMRAFDGGVGSLFDVHWQWGPNRTDGGAYRGFHNLQRGQSVTIDASFTGDVNRWEVRENVGHNSSNGEMKQLEMGHPVVIERGANCLDPNVGAIEEPPAEVGASVTFRAEEGANVYRWDFDGNGTVDATTSTNTVQHTFNTTGLKEVSVTMSAHNQTVTARTTVEVDQGESPTARVSFEPGDKGLDSYHVVGEQVVLNASGSFDETSSLADAYRWNLSDGTNVTTNDPTLTHAFDESGTYEVTVEVRDAAGNTANVTKTIEIDDEDSKDPTARAEATPGEVEVGANVSFLGGDSSDNRGIASYEWDLDGDGTVDAEGEQARWSYDANGTVEATLEVEDGAGNNDTETVNVTVLEQKPPNVTDWSQPAEVTAGAQIDLAATATDNGQITSYRWTLGGETIATGASATATVPGDYSSRQNVTLELVVVDRAGVRTTETAAVTVLPPDENPPDANLSVGDNRTRVGKSVTFDANASTDPPHDDIAAYHWDFDGNGTIDATSTDPVVSHEFGSTGTYNATVVVEDASGNNGTATVNVTVRPEKQAKRDRSNSRSNSRGVGGSEVPVVTNVEQRGETAAVVDVKNAKGDETTRASLPDAVAVEDGVQFRAVTFDLASDDAHVVFRTTANASAPAGTDPLAATDATLGYLTIDAKYLDRGVENATVEFAVEQSALGDYGVGSDVAVYQYDGEWTRLNATVVGETDDAYRLRATTDSLGTLAVGATEGLTVADAGLDADTVTVGENVTATVTVENAASDARNVTLDLGLDGTAVATKTVEVPAGESREVALAAAVDEPGTYEVTVGGVPAGTLAVEEQSSDPGTTTTTTTTTTGTATDDAGVTEVTLNESTIAAGERVRITATVENPGGESVERTVTLTLFGEDLTSRTVTVPPGETKQVTFVQQVEAPGTYTVEVNGETAKLEVTGDDGGDSTDTPAPDVPGFGVGAAVVALLAAALLARRRR